VLAVNNMTVQLLDAQNLPISDSTVDITDVVPLNLYAVLNYIFFEDSSSVLPERYVQIPRDSISSFNESSVNGLSTMSIYHHTLNIVGTRMRQRPAAKLTLTGCTADVDREHNASALAKDRAQTVKDYLVNVWGIDEGRIKITGRGLPSLPSNPKSPDGQGENRRVEITSDDKTILDPLYFTDTVRTTNAPVIKAGANITADAGVRRWKLIVRQGDKIISEQKGEGAPPETLQYDVESSLQELPKIKKPLKITLEVEDNDGRIRTAASPEIAVRQFTRSDKTVERFTLIIFGFNESAFSAKHEEILGIVKTRIKPSSTVSVAGYTDRSGSPEYNIRLSEKRAVETGKRLAAAGDRVKGFGPTDMFDNNLPEGRLFCRTVLITVETPNK